MREEIRGKVAMCICGAPLVSTLAYRKYEFYCLDCGRHVTYFGPTPAEPTTELLLKVESYTHQWESLSAGLIGDGAMYRHCNTCATKHEPHRDHASEAELAADVLARRDILHRQTVTIQ